MPKMLSDEAIRFYNDAGYVSPLDATSHETARRWRDGLEAAEAAQGGRLPDDLRRKLHLTLPWADEAVRHPRILDAVEDLIGPDILVFHLTLWAKDAHSDAFVAWHQDSTYFGLSPAEHVTAWVALSMSDEVSGAVEVVPGSHHAGQLRHDVVRSEQNMFATGQRIPVPDDAARDLLVLRPGQFSLHHTYLWHNSRPNRSDDRRIGLGISYIPTRVRCAARTRLTATLVRGEDRYGHFDHDEVRPTAPFDAAAMAGHARAMARWHEARAELIAAAHAPV
jgi:hypothetical protein